MKSNGIESDQQLVQVGALPSAVNEFDLLWDALDRVLRAEPSVICCANDRMAMRVYGPLRERGLAIPRDISVAGYNDYRTIAEHLHPGLTNPTSLCGYGGQSRRQAAAHHHGHAAPG